MLPRLLLAPPPPLPPLLLLEAAAMAAREASAAQLPRPRFVHQFEGAGSPIVDYAGLRRELKF
ncbi:hypothetical protein BOTBODRAFT_181986 [Botryobasidium botryosum FD-172 SS1]|uniref:Uncharacterized protein n=1 Tax=Botryobasidium botryosum (strain FD-172 SS1) TaxID=930990 RepID=A0A067LS19_BOTB1|nr:hypothetical protein BOTBODRAFT_181986 [Botryobasidium botryosum FD-172 SS1]